MVIDMKEIGKMIKEMEMVLYLCVMVINMLVNGKMVKNQEKEFIIFNMEMFMMVLSFNLNLIGYWLGGMRHGFGKY